MPDTWDPVVYRERAKAWREKAAALCENDPGRAISNDGGEAFSNTIPSS